MEDARFDRLTRTLSRVGTRRGTLAGLAGGFLLPLSAADPMAAKAHRHDDDLHGETWRHKKCPHGLTKCTFKKGKKKKYRCVDMQTDSTNCGACRNACPAGQVCQGGTCTGSGPVCAGCLAGTTCQPGTSAEQCGTNGAACQVCTGDECNEPACDKGTCTTTPAQGKACDGDTGICDASGKCQPAICVGKISQSPCFPFSSSTCNTSGAACYCGTDINGINSCYENAYCNGPNEQCTSNADCEASLGRPGSICFLAEGLCCLGRTGCTTPCPRQ